MSPATDTSAFHFPIFLLSLTLFLIVFLAAFRRSRDISTLPPGALGLPFIGETLRLIAAYRTENPEPFVDERVRRHRARLFTTHLFGERTVFSADPEFNRVVVAGEGRVFEGSYPSSIATLLGRHSLVLMKGALHKRMHALTLTRFASPAVIRSLFLPEIDRAVRRNLRSWPTELRLLEQAKKITFELSVAQLISVGAGEWTEDLRRHYNALIDGFFSVPFPSFLSFTTYGRAVKARKKVAEALMVLVRRRREEKMSDNSGIETERMKKKDMVDELLEAKEGLMDNEIVDFLLALLVAGHETTPTIMALTAKFLADNPSSLVVLKEEQEEIRRKKKDDFDALEWGDYKSMPFTQCVINETLRIANIVSGVFRRAVADIHYKGYTIPKGCKVFASFRAVHLDNDYYEDARTFNPWRWMNHNNNNDKDLFTPFGGGQRLCPGYELGRVEISVFLHYLVTCFSWEVEEKDKLVFFPTTRMLKGYPIHVRQHRSL